MTYTKTVWTDDSGEAIDQTNLNKIEQGIYDNSVHAESTHASSDADNTASNETSHTDVLVDSDTLNPVTVDNLILTEASLDGLGGDMLKSVYDTDNNGIVDNSEKVNNLTVETAVPSGAVFTDTTYPEITATTGGVLSDTDAIKFDGIPADIVLARFNTGIKEGGVVTLNTDIKKVDIETTEYTIQGVDYTYAGITGYSPDLQVGQSARRLGLDASGLVDQAGKFTDAQLQTILPIARMQAPQGQTGPGSDLKTPMHTHYYIGEEGWRKRLWHTKVIGVLYADGGIVSESSTALQLNESSGLLYNAQAHDVDIIGGNNITGVELYHVAGDWTLGTDATIVIDVQQWDDPNTGLTTLNNNKWAMHTLLRSPKEDGEFFLIYSQAQYASQADAEAVPPDYGFFQSQSFSGFVAIAQIIIQKGDTSITQIKDTRPFIGGNVGAVLGTANLQQTLENSANPEMSMATEALTFKEGADVATNDVIEVVDFDDTQVFAVTGEGKVTLKSANVDLLGSNSVVVDGATNERTITVGAYRQLHKAGVPNTRAINLEVDANGYSDTSGIVVNYQATSLSAGDTGNALELNVDTNASTGGKIEAIFVRKSGDGTVGVRGMCIGSGIGPVHQISGAATSIEQAFTYDDSGTSFADVTAAFNATGTNVTIFEEVNDYVYVGHSSKFSELDFILGTLSSKTIDPTFEFSIGTSSWTVYTPSDGTNGMLSSGVLFNNIDNMTGWTTDTVNSVSDKFWIRIKRTRNTITTPPIESKVTVTEGTQYRWDENGDLSVNDVIVAGTVDGRDVATDGTKLDGIATGADVTSTNETSHADVLVDGDIGVNVQAYSSVLDATTASFLTADETKLDGIAESANNYSHPTGDGNLHVPANSTTNDGKVLTASATAGVYTWETSGGGSTTLVDLTDTTITSPTDTQVLTYDNATSKWINADAAGGGGGIGEFIDTSIAISSDDTALSNDDGNSRDNIGLGANAGANITSGYENVYMGWNAGKGGASSSAYKNVCIGGLAGFDLTNGYHNIFLGPTSGYNVTTGHNNILFGSGAGTALTTGTNNTMIGQGTGALAGNTTNNVFIGYRAGYKTSGSNNIYLGYYVAQGATGGDNSNVGLGYRTLANITSGYKNIVLGTDAGKLLSSGHSNILMGEFAGAGAALTGNNNIAMGYLAGYSIASGTNNIFLGYMAGRLETGSNQLRIANNQTTALIHGDFASETLSLNAEVTIKDFLTLTPTGTAPGVNNSFYVDSADGILKFKDNTGTIRTVNLT